MIASEVAADCRHCGLPVPIGLINPAQPAQFCCQGCHSAYQLISASGHEAFYAMVDSASESQTLRKRENSLNFEHLDDPGFMDRFVHSLPNGNLEIKMALDGIHCAACIWLVEKLPSMVGGVQRAQVNWSRGTVRLEWEPAQTQLSSVAQSLHRLGYTPHPIRVNESGLRRQMENRQQLARIGVAFAAAGNNMLIATALYLGMFSHMESAFVTLLRWVSCLIGVGSLIGPGRVFLKSGWNALRTWTPHMDLPIALGLLAGTINGLVNTIRGTGEIYFDSLSVLICLLLIGRWIQFRQQNRAADAVELLYRLTPQRARKLVNGNVVEVMIEDVVVGDQIEIRPGDIVPTDAVVVSGSSQVDQSILTGEAKPQTKHMGDSISAGSKNISSLLVAQASAVGQETRISKIVELVEQASNQKPQIVQWANRIGGYFVIIVIALAVLTFALWNRTDRNLATDNAIALLVIACPCALAMATPLAISVALGRLAKHRIMVKSGDVMQALDKAGMVWLDKTGTLTEGKLQVIQWIGDRSAIAWVAAAEEKLTHPIATAFSEFHSANTIPIDAPEWKVPCPRDPEGSRVENQRAHAGGVSATVCGHNVLIGNCNFLLEQGIDRGCMPEFESWEAIEKDLLKAQLSPCWVAVDGTIKAIAGLGDKIRADAELTLSQLRKRGWKIGVLSGDHPEVVARVASELKIEDFRGGLTPEGKVAAIQESSQTYPTTVMVGDGVNDSAALAVASVGIAVHKGAEASLAAAPVYLGDAGLVPIINLFSASRTTCSTIRRNLAVSLAYNFLGAGLAMAGVLHPLLAALLMPISSLTVIGLSLQAGKIDEVKEDSEWKTAGASRP